MIFTIFIYYFLPFVISKVSFGSHGIVKFANNVVINMEMEVS